MKMTFKTILTGIAALGVLIPAAYAEDFVIDRDKYDRHQNEMRAMSDNNSRAKHPGFQKGRYSGSSAYTGGLTGRVAYRNDRAGNDGRRGFSVHPVRGADHEFNSTLRYGDTGQSRETRFNHSFNN